MEQSSSSHFVDVFFYVMILPLARQTSLRKFPDVVGSPSSISCEATYVGLQLMTHTQSSALLNRVHTTSPALPGDALLPPHRFDISLFSLSSLFCVRNDRNSINHDVNHPFSPLFISQNFLFARFMTIKIREIRQTSRANGVPVSQLFSLPCLLTVKKDPLQKVSKT